jgi:hypothetical protein
VAEARQRRHDGIDWAGRLRLCGLRMLGFCLGDVIMTPVCRPETVVFSPLMLLPGVEGRAAHAPQDARRYGSTEHPTVSSARFDDPLAKRQFTDGKGGT